MTDWIDLLLNVLGLWAGLYSALVATHLIFNDKGHRLATLLIVLAASLNFALVIQRVTT